MKVLGIDPGSRVLGYGIVDEDGGRLTLIASGEIKPGAKASLSSKLLEISRSLEDVIRTHRPDAVSIESVFFSKNVKSMVVMSQVRGVVLLKGAEAGLSIYEYSPKEIKQSVTGYGSAEKAQVQQMVKSLLKLEKAPGADEADSLAAAICHLHSYRLALAGGTDRRL